MAKQPNLVQIGNVVQLGIGGHKVTNDTDHVKITAADGTTLARTKMADAVASNEAYTLGQATTAFSAYSNVDNTSDANKPVSTATQTALDLKADAADLTNVDNTSDANKPVSTAQQAEIDTKEDAVTWGNGLENAAGTASVSLSSASDPTITLSSVDTATNVAGYSIVEKDGSKVQAVFARQSGYDFHIKSALEAGAKITLSGMTATKFNVEYEIIRFESGGFTTSNNVTWTSTISPSFPQFYWNAANSFLLGWDDTNDVWRVWDLSDATGDTSDVLDMVSGTGYSWSSISLVLSSASQSESLGSGAQQELTDEIYDIPASSISQVTYTGSGKFPYYLYQTSGGTQLLAFNADEGRWVAIKPTTAIDYTSTAITEDAEIAVSGASTYGDASAVSEGSDDFGNGIKIPPAASSNVTYTAGSPDGFLEFVSGDLVVMAEDVATGSTDHVPTSSSVKTALAGKEPTITAGTTGQYWRGDKSWQTLSAGTVGLENCDNTSDANKPVSTATQTALDLKANDNAVIKKDGSVAFTGAVDAGSNKVTNVTNGTADSDAATVGQMNTAIATNSVIDFQNTVAVVTSLDSYTYANGTSGVGATITANANGAWDSADSDGVSLSVGDAVTIPSTAITSGLSNASEAGIYTVTSVGGAVSTWVFTRAVPSDQSVEWLKGRICRVDAGGPTYGSKFYQFQGNSNPTIGTDALTLVQVGDVSLGANSVGETELNLGDGLVDADSFVLSSAYSQGSADTLPAAGDTAEEAVEKLSGIVDVSGYTPENYTAADDTLAAHVEGIDAELEGWNKVFIKTLTHTDGTVLIKTAPSGSTIMEVEFIVNTAFNGTDPNLTIGTPADNDKYVVTSDVDLATQDSARDVATVKVRETFSAGTAINAYLTPDGSTAGSVDVFVRLRK